MQLSQYISRHLIHKGWENLTVLYIISDIGCIIIFCPNKQLHDSIIIVIAGSDAPAVPNGKQFVFLFVIGKIVLTVTLVIKPIAVKKSVPTWCPVDSQTRISDTGYSKQVVHANGTPLCIQFRSQNFPVFLE